MFPPLVVASVQGAKFLELAHLSYSHLISCSFNSLTFTLVPIPAYLPPALFYFLFSALHSRRSPSPSCFISLNIELIFSFVYICSDREKLAILECDLGVSGVHLGPLEDLHSSLITLIKNTVPSSALWESPALRHFSFSLAVQPILDEYFVAGRAAYFWSLFIFWYWRLCLKGILPPSGLFCALNSVYF